MCGSGGGGQRTKPHQTKHAFRTFWNSPYFHQPRCSCCCCANTEHCTATSAVLAERRSRTMIRSRAAASLRRENGAGFWSRTLRLTKDRSYASVTTSTPGAINSTTATQRWSLSGSNGSAAAAASAREMHCHDTHGTSSGYRRSSAQRWRASSSPGIPNSAYICQPLRRWSAFSSSAGSGSSAIGMRASGNVDCGGGRGGIPARVVSHVMHMTTSAVPGKKKRKKSSAESGETANGITFETGKVMSHERYLLCYHVPVCLQRNLPGADPHGHIHMICRPPEAGEASMHLRERGFGCHAIRMLLQL